jgi:hypothetical protein
MNVNAKLRKATLEELRDFYDWMKKQFHPGELKRLEHISRMCTQGRYCAYGLWDGDMLLAYALLANAEKVFLLDYYAVLPQYQDSGWGSRFLGMLVGAAVLVAGNPFLVLALSPIVLVNGGGGLAKLVLLRTAKKFGFDIGEDAAIRRIRFPLHDHCKKNLGWSNAQVLMRFTLLQLVVMPLLLLILVKVR